MARLIDKASSVGVKIHRSVEHARVDPIAFEKAIDAAGRAVEAFPVLRVGKGGKGGITLMFDKHMQSGDFAMVYQNKPSIIHLNESAYASDKALEREYAKLVESGWFVSGTDSRSVVFHEVGHMLVHALGVNQKDLVMTAIGARCEADLFYNLRKELSGYSVANGYLEIIPEAVSAWLSASTNKVAEAIVKSVL